MTFDVHLQVRCTSLFYESELTGHWVGLEG
jgi:hypothetical protein